MSAEDSTTILQDVSDGADDITQALAISLALGKHFGSKRHFDMRNKLRDARECIRRSIPSGVDVMECGTRGEGYRGSFSTTSNVKLYKQFDVLCTVYDAQRNPISFALSEMRGKFLHCRIKLITHGLPPNHPIYGLCKQDNDDYYLSYQRLYDCSSQELGLSTRDSVAGPKMEPYDDNLVVGLPCSTWPPPSFSMVQRPRRSGWPSQEIMTRMLRKGCFVIPSDNPEDDETVFMLSFALPERELVQSFNQTHIIIYGYWLTIIQERLSAPLKRFLHGTVVKHCLFWLIQEYPWDIWREINVMRCMELLLTKVIDVTDNRSCPHFFVRRHDLFAGMTTEIAENILNFLQTVKRKGWRYIFELSPFRHLERQFGTLQESFPQMCVTSLEEERRFDYVFIQELHHTRMELRRLFDQLIKTSKPGTTTVFSFIRNIRDRSSPVLYEDIKPMMTSYLSLLMGCHLQKALPGLKQNRQRFIYITLIESLLREGSMADMATAKLKMATLYLYLEQSDKCLKVIESIKHNSADHIVINMARRYTSEGLVEDLANDKAYEAIVCGKGFSLLDKMSLYVASSKTEFTKEEYATSPTAIQYEMSVVFGQKDSRFEVDSLVYGEFLAVVCNHGLGSVDDMDVSLGLLRQLVKHSPRDAVNIHVYHNLLGHCYVLANKIKEALLCFAVSLRLRETDNAALKHLKDLRSLRGDCAVNK